MNFEIPESVWYFECEYTELFNQYMSDIAAGVQTYVEPNKYPTITRELNFVMESKQATNRVGELLRAIDPRIQDVCVIDVYSHSEKIGAGKKSVTFRFSIVDRTKTITDEEALSLQNTCIETLGSR
jgi:phenylalanyl-tRNA synthetase beta subunit